MRKKIVLAMVLLLVAMSTLMFSVQPGKAPKTSVVIGWAHPMSGPAAPTAAVHDAYYKYIIEDYNKKGGLNVPGIGKLPITYVEYDDTYDQTRNHDLYVKLITEDKVDLLFSPWSTGFCIADLPLFSQYKYPVIGTTVGSNEMDELLISGAYSGENMWYFLTLGQPLETGSEVGALISYINEEIATADTRISKIGINYASSEHGVQYAGAIYDNLTAQGMTVPVYDSYSWIPGTIPTNWVPEITKMRDNKVDVVIMCGYDEAAAFVQQCIGQNYNPKLIIVGPTMETPVLVYGPFGFTPGSAAGIAYYDGWPATRYNTPALEAWAIDHLNRLHYLPFPASVIFYSGLDCQLKAVEERGLDGTAIRNALATETFDTLVGKWKFVPGRAPQTETGGTICQWHGGGMMDVIWPVSVETAKIIYPMYPWSWAKVPDVNRDGILNIMDIYIMAKGFGTKTGDARYMLNPGADINGDGIVNIMDIFQVARAFGQKVVYSNDD